jgi:hypothetical protein
MKSQHIAKLEAQLEQLIEGAFANLFGNRIQAQDIALRLARAMEDNLAPPHGHDARALAPDHYVIYTHPDVQAYLLEKHPQLPYFLAGHLTELATHNGYRLNGKPVIKILADSHLDTGELIITASHSNQASHSTEAMKRVELPSVRKPPQSQLVIDQNRTLDLTEDIINIGRGLDNHIILDDPFISRHHVQIRLRFGVYMLFDAHSQSGTYVNEVQVKEHRLQSGDVIRIGKTHMLYLQDDDDIETGQTDAPDL